MNQFLTLLALDQSTTALGYCQMDGPRIVSAGSQRFKGDRINDRTRLVIAFCRKLFDQIPTGSIVTLERTWLAGGKRTNPATLDALAELRGRLIGLAESAGHDVRVVHPAEWRQWFGIRVNTPREAAKAMAIQVASRLLPIVGKDDDLADAICMAEWMRGQLQREDVERRVGARA